MPGREPRPGDIYIHFKGNKYQVTAIAIDVETEEKCVVYQALYGEFKTFVRKYDDFIAEVDRIKYPQVGCRYRFSSDIELEEPVEDAETSERKPVVQDYEMRELKHPEDEGEINPDLLAFLEAETVREKLEVFDRIQDRMTEGVLCAIEASMDISYEEDNMEERIYYVRNYLKTRERYEGTRLR